MSQAPNEEQLKAIEHQGGVLLSAGAGSGKTFVLKEHILYLCKQWMKEYKQSSLDTNYDQFIVSKFRKIALMTFTKKAAGELEIRLKKELNMALEQSSVEDQYFWRENLNNIDYLTVGTIHSFLLKLIKSGFFPDISTDVEIVSEGKFKKFIIEKLDEWLLKTKLSVNSSEYIQLLKNKDKVETALIQVFSDPSLRELWVGGFSDDFLKSSETLINDLVYELDLMDVVNKKIPSFDRGDKRQWAKFLAEFDQNFPTFDGHFESFIEIIHFFKKRDFKIPNKPSVKNVDPIIVDYYEKIKELKDFIKKNSDNFLLFYEHKDGHAKSWSEILRNIVKYIENEYYKLEGLTFSDLEYLTFKNLTKETAQHIASEYRYFIIDEFQDTSFIQFQIISLLAEQDFKRLFCVGDPKQAIYGFRGGEVGVFLSCQEKVPLNLTLKNNYRSTRRVIDFNNKFFHFIFNKGPGFKGHDPLQVPVIFQEFPFEEIMNEKDVSEIHVPLDFELDKQKLSNADTDYIEALGIINQIKEYQLTQTAVLYRRLKPSLILIDLLIENGIGFTAQVKIPFLEDPLIGIFKILIQYEFNQGSQRDEYTINFLNSYMALLQGRGHKKIKISSIDRYLEEKAYYGVELAFYRFLESLQVSVSNFTNSLSAICEIIKTSYGNDTIMALEIEKIEELSYSFDFKWGENSDKVILMSAHASKGLQFENVILGGIYTNDYTPPFNSPVGKLPESFKWSPYINSKKSYKSPGMILEEIINKKKEFSESKRLFYVANTRAKRNLNFVHIDFASHKRQKSSSGAWASALSFWKNEREELPIKNSFNIQGILSEQLNKEKASEPPLFHKDSLGINKKAKQGKSFILPELSVTRLATAAQCPRKFYFESYCRFSNDDLEVLSNFLPKEHQLELLDTELGSAISSTERGNLFHDSISKAIKSGFKDKTSESIPEILWAVENLRNYRDNFFFISEKQIKFPLLNYMITAIPDLVMLKKNSEQLNQIWDFKTGLLKKNNHNVYQTQLYAYAYGLYELEMVKKDELINLVLCYIDEKQLVEEKVSFENVNNFFQKLFPDLNSPWKINTSFCSVCEFNLICQKNNQ